LIQLQVHLVGGQILEYVCKSWLCTDHILRVTLPDGCERCIPMRRVEFFDSLNAEVAVN
jgi:hypothetical protein